MNVEAIEKYIDESIKKIDNLHETFVKIKTVGKDRPVNLSREILADYLKTIEEIKEFCLLQLPDSDKQKVVYENIDALKSIIEDNVKALKNSESALSSETRIKQCLDTISLIDTYGKEVNRDFDKRPFKDNFIGYNEEGRPSWQFGEEIVSIEKKADYVKLIVLAVKNNQKYSTNSPTSETDKPKIREAAERPLSPKVTQIKNRKSLNHELQQRQTSSEGEISAVKLEPNPELDKPLETVQPELKEDSSVTLIDKNGNDIYSDFKTQLYNLNSSNPSDIEKAKQLGEECFNSLLSRANELGFEQSQSIKYCELIRQGKTEEDVLKELNNPVNTEENPGEIEWEELQNVEDNKPIVTTSSTKNDLIDELAEPDVVVQTSYANEMAFRKAQGYSPKEVMARTR